MRVSSFRVPPFLVRRAPALSPTGPVRDYLFDHIHATMVSTRAGAGSSTTTRLGGWLYSSSMRAMPSTCVDKKTDVSDAQWLQAAMMPGKSKMTVTGQPARRGEGIDLGNGVRKTTLSPSDGVRVLWCVTRQYGRGGASGKSDGRVHPDGGNRPRPPIRRVPFAGVCPASGLL
jgi:hypothetical protein